jgi:hypothetical protein
MKFFIAGIVLFTISFIAWLLAIWGFWGPDVSEKLGSTGGFILIPAIVLTAVGVDRVWLSGR